MRPTRLAVAVAALCLATAAHADVSRPGKYDYSVKVTMMGMGMPAINFSQCVTKKDIDEGKAYVNKEQKGCTYSDMKREGDRISFRMSCSDPKMTGQATGTIGAEAFTIDMQAKITEPMQMEQRSTVSAKRVGDC
ncbi:hypothetical protein DSM104443_00169 [Usitatibacter rugosus]|uniref:DUF3617 family protein n=1 Tax=Usitatibacter rugosus TaxID=2732067 RepID=A0A6M4GS34_9PROT|nr:DUF3617 family protein [Usitatibacter rugosus]QJR09133.1 hypothetical protein DSM104443_00169 [Usitatibacter rugosus]